MFVLSCFSFLYFSLSFLFWSAVPAGSGGNGGNEAVLWEKTFYERVGGSQQVVKGNCEEAAPDRLQMHRFGVNLSESSILRVGYYLGHRWAYNL
jgi:hypothetical protein